MICSSLWRARFMGLGSVCPFRGRPLTQLWPTHRGKLTQGVLQTTFPGISQTYDAECSHSRYWNFTKQSSRRLFEEIFPTGCTSIEAYGNVLATISFLHGLADNELAKEELDYYEPGYELTLGVRAVKPDN
jgi:hypothetical protein